MVEVENFPPTSVFVKLRIQLYCKAKAVHIDWLIRLPPSGGASMNC